MSKIIGPITLKLTVHMWGDDNRPVTATVDLPVGEVPTEESIIAEARKVFEHSRNASVMSPNLFYSKVVRQLPGENMVCAPPEFQYDAIDLLGEDGFTRVLDEIMSILGESQ